jgi:hypothetical protein
VGDNKGFCYYRSNLSRKVKMLTRIRSKVVQSAAGVLRTEKSESQKAVLDLVDTVHKDYVAKRRMPSADSISDDEFYEASSDSSTGTVVLRGAVTSAQGVSDNKVAKVGDNEAVKRTIAKRGVSKVRNGHGDSSSTEEYSDGDRRSVVPRMGDKRAQKVGDNRGNGRKGDSMTVKDKQKRRSVVDSDSSDASTADEDAGRRQGAHQVSDNRESGRKSCGFGAKSKGSDRSVLLSDDSESGDVRHQVAHVSDNRESGKKNCGVGVKNKRSDKSACVSVDSQSDVETRRQVALQVGDNRESSRKRGNKGVKNKPSVRSASASDGSESETSRDADARRQVAHKVSDNGGDTRKSAKNKQGGKSVAVSDDSEFEVASDVDSRYQVARHVGDNRAKVTKNSGNMPKGSRKGQKVTNEVDESVTDSRDTVQARKSALKQKKVTMDEELLRVQAQLKDAEKALAEAYSRDQDWLIEREDFMENNQGMAAVLNEQAEEIARLRSILEPDDGDIGEKKVKNGAANVKNAVERKRCTDGDGDDDEDFSTRSGRYSGSSDPNDNHTPRQQQSQVRSSRANNDDEDEPEVDSRVSNRLQPMRKERKMDFFTGTGNIESYLAQFRRVARRNGWPRSEWADELVACLRGDAREFVLPNEDVEVPGFEELCTAEGAF